MPGQPPVPFSGQDFVDTARRIHIATTPQARKPWLGTLARFPADPGCERATHTLRHRDAPPASFAADCVGHSLRQTHCDAFHTGIIPYVGPGGWRVRGTPHTSYAVGGGTTVTAVCTVVGP